MKRINVLTPVFISLLIFLFWFAVVWRYARIATIFPPGDFQRDTAITYNILAGNILGDANYLSEHAWYPFLSHLLYAGYQLLTRIPVPILYLNYPFLLSIPTIILFVFSVWKIFKSSFLTCLSLFSFLFIIPATSGHLNVATHPFLLAYGTLALTIYLFYRATSSVKGFDWILAGLGIALVVYSQPFAALALCGGIVLYQLLTRTLWRNFFLMVVISFIFTSPFILPLIVFYKLHAINTLNISFLHYSLTPDNLFYGYGNIRWINSFLILSGIFAAALRRNNLDRFLLSMFFFPLFFVIWGLATDKYGQLLGLTQFRLPPSFVWQDMMGLNHFIATFFFSLGLWYLIKQLSLLSNITISQAKTTLMLFVITLSLYAYFMIPRFVQRASSWYPSQQTYIPYDTNWQKITNWVNKNTSIYDVFMAHPGPAYLFIAGLTGRKVLVTDDWHSNPFVDQQQRRNDLIFLYSTTNIEKFVAIAKKYKISYVVVSPYEELITQEGLQKFSTSNIFLPVFSSGKVYLYRVRY